MRPKNYNVITVICFLLLVRGAWGEDCPSSYFSGIGVKAHCYKNWDEDGAIYLHIKSSGLPEHSYDGSPVPQNWTFDIPVAPDPDLVKPYQDQLDPSTLGHGPIGIALNGVPFYPPFGSDGIASVAPPPLYSEIDAQGNSVVSYPKGLEYDNCAGFVVDEAYRYYTAPPCLEDDTSAKTYTPWTVIEAFETPNTLIGYALDGFPIYSPHNSTSFKLDNCNGKFVGGEYRYYATARFPFLLGCFGPGVYDYDVSAIDEEVWSDLAACPPGSFLSSARGGCQECPAGTYDYASGSDTVAARAPCSEVCPVGHYCPAGTSYPNMVKCPAGTFGSTAGLKTQECSGPCAPGYFCPPGTVDPVSLPCGNPSFYCPAGSAQRITVRDGFYTVPEGDGLDRIAQQPCEPGSYCLEGVKSPCSAGTFASAKRQTSCEPCTTGHYCPEGSPVPIACPPGTYGGELGLKNADCSGLCDFGHFCPSGSNISAQIECPPGSFGNVRGLGSFHCNASCDAVAYPEVACVATKCSPGYFCPSGSNSSEQAECGGAEVYCPSGSAIPTPVSRGYYTVGALSVLGKDQDSEDAAVRWGQRICEPGFYCTEGVRLRCPAGTYGGSSGLTNEECSGPCSAGYYCPIASISDKQIPCGGADVYCPEGSPNKTDVTEGYFTTGGQVDSRISERICPLGHYCVAGVKRPCPPGVYGGGEGLSSAACSGNCTAGFYCEEGSTMADQEPCPPGTWGDEGQKTDVCSGLCHPGYYCPTNSTAPTQLQCGGDRVFCPVGSGAPSNVSAGHFSTGGDYLTRSGQAPCDEWAGLAPAGAHREAACPENLVPEEHA